MQSDTSSYQVVCTQTQTQLLGPPTCTLAMHTYPTHVWGFAPWYAPSIFTNLSQHGIPNKVTLYTIHLKWWQKLTLSGSHRSAIFPAAVYGQNEMLDIISVRHSVWGSSLLSPEFCGFPPKAAYSIPPVLRYMNYSIRRSFVASEMSVFCCHYFNSIPLQCVCTSRILDFHGFQLGFLRV